MRNKRREMGVIHPSIKEKRTNVMHATMARIMQEIMLKANLTHTKAVMPKQEPGFSEAFQDIIYDAATRKLTTIEAVETQIPSYHRHKNNFINEYKDQFCDSVDISEIEAMLNEWLIQQIDEKLPLYMHRDEMDVDACAALMASTLKITEVPVLQAPNWRRKNTGSSIASPSEHMNVDILSPASSSNSSL